MARASPQNIDAAQIPKLREGASEFDCMIINVAELERNSDSSSWKLTISLESASRSVNSSFISELDAPLTASDREELQWYFNSYLIDDPFRATRAEIAEQIFTKARHSLLRCISPAFQIIHRKSNANAYKVTLHVVADGTSSSIHSLPWEILEGSVANDAQQVFSVDLNVTRGCSTRQLTYSPTLTKLEHSPRILIVSSRVQEEGDISHGLILRNVWRTVSELDGIDVRKLISFVRPGSFPNLEAVLRDSGKKSIDILHLDMHGSLDKKTGKAHVWFACNGGSSWKPQAITAHRLAKVLVRYKVRCVILNACLSAVAGESGVSNFAYTLCEAGVPCVLGISYSISSQTAVAFMKAFYKTLIHEQSSLKVAVSCGRAACRSLGLESASSYLDLTADHSILPQLYTLGDTKWFCSLSRTDHVDESKPSKETVRLWDMITQLVSPRHCDTIMHMAESRLIHRPLLIMHGESGIGKTFLASYLSSWWKETGFVGETVMFDCRNIDETKPSIRELIRAQVKELNNSRHIRSVEELHIKKIEPMFDRLFVVDNFWIQSSSELEPDSEGASQANKENGPISFLNWFLEEADQHHCAMLLTSSLPRFVLEKELPTFDKLSVPYLSTAEAINLMRMAVETTRKLAGEDFTFKLAQKQGFLLKTLLRLRPLRQPRLLILLANAWTKERPPLDEIFQLVEGSFTLPKLHRAEESLISTMNEMGTNMGPSIVFDSKTGTELLVQYLENWRQHRPTLYWLTLSLVMFREAIHRYLGVWIQALAQEKFFELTIARDRSNPETRDNTVLNVADETLSITSEYSDIFRLLRDCGFTRGAQEDHHGTEYVSVNPLLHFVLRWILRTKEINIAAKAFDLLSQAFAGYHYTFLQRLNGKIHWEYPLHVSETSNMTLILHTLAAGTELITHNYHNINLYRLFLHAQPHDHYRLKQVMRTTTSILRRYQELHELFPIRWFRPKGDAVNIKLHHLTGITLLHCLALCKLDNPLQCIKTLEESLHTIDTWTDVTPTVEQYPLDTYCLRCLLLLITQSRSVADPDVITSILEYDLGQLDRDNDTLPQAILLKIALAMQVKLRASSLPEDHILQNPESMIASEISWLMVQRLFPEELNESTRYYLNSLTAPLFGLPESVFAIDQVFELIDGQFVALNSVLRSSISLPTVPSFENPVRGTPYGQSHQDPEQSIKATEKLLQTAIIKEDYWAQFYHLNHLLIWSTIQRNLDTAERLSYMMLLAHWNCSGGIDDQLPLMRASDRTSIEIYADRVRRTMFLSFILCSQEHQSQFDNSLLSFEQLHKYEFPPFVNRADSELVTWMENHTLETIARLKTCRSSKSKQCLARNYANLHGVYAGALQIDGQPVDLPSKAMQAFLDYLRLDYVASTWDTTYPSRTGVLLSMFRLWLESFNTVGVWLDGFLKSVLQWFGASVVRVHRGAVPIENCMAEELGWTHSQVRSYFVQIRTGIGARTIGLDEREQEFLDEAVQILVATDLESLSLQLWKYDSSRGWISCFQPSTSGLSEQWYGDEEAAFGQWYVNFCTYKD